MPTAPAVSSRLRVRLPTALRSRLDRLREARERTITDRSTARRIRRALAAAPLGPLGLALFVHDGAVSVYGSVPGESVREQIVALVVEQPGVRRVVDHLRVETD